MGTAISKTLILGVAALAITASGCGATNTTTSPGSSATTTGVQTQLPRAASGRRGFAWLQPAPAPSGWRVVRIASRAVLRYPSGWRRVRGDVGTATAVLQDPRHAFLGYLNLTPRQGDENLSNWALFRTAHNMHEGDSDVRALGSATGLPFGNGRGSCVRDSYTTNTGHRFTELACLIQGPMVASVIVGAAPPQMWARISPIIERAISATTT